MCACKFYRPPVSFHIQVLERSACATILSPSPLRGGLCISVPKRHKKRSRTNPNFLPKIALLRWIIVVPFGVADGMFFWNLLQR